MIATSTSSLDCMDSGLAGFQLGDVEAFFAPGQHEVVEPTNHIATVTDRGRGPCLAASRAIANAVSTASSLECGIWVIGRPVNGAIAGVVTG